MSLFQTSFQGGSHFEIFTAQGANPLTNWKVSGTQKTFDKNIKGNVFVCSSPNNAFMQIPKDEKKSMYLTQPFLLFQLIIPQISNFSIELNVIDTQNNKKRIHLSTSFKEPSSTPLHARVPLIELQRGTWMNLCIDIPDLVTANFKGATFRCVENITLRAYFSLRRVFTMKDRPFDSFGPSDSFKCVEIPRNFWYPSSEQLVQMVTSEKIRQGTENIEAQSSSAPSNIIKKTSDVQLAFGKRIEPQKAEETPRPVSSSSKITSTPVKNTVPGPAPTKISRVPSKIPKPSPKKGLTPAKSTSTTVKPTLSHSSSSTSAKSPRDPSKETPRSFKNQVQVELAPLSPAKDVQLVRYSMSKDKEEEEPIHMNGTNSRLSSATSQQKFEARNVHSSLQNRAISSAHQISNLLKSARDSANNWRTVEKIADDEDEGVIIDDEVYSDDERNEIDEGENDERNGNYEQNEYDDNEAASEGEIVQSDDENDHYQPEHVQKSFSHENLSSEKHEEIEEEEEVLEDDHYEEHYDEEMNQDELAEEALMSHMERYNQDDVRKSIMSAQSSRAPSRMNTSRNVPFDSMESRNTSRMSSKADMISSVQKSHRDEIKSSNSVRSVARNDAKSRESLIPSSKSSQSIKSMTSSPSNGISLDIPRSGSKQTLSPLTFSSRNPDSNYYSHETKPRSTLPIQTTASPRIKKNIRMSNRNESMEDIEPLVERERKRVSSVAISNSVKESIDGSEEGSDGEESDEVQSDESIEYMENVDDDYVPEVHQVSS